MATYDTALVMDRGGANPRHVRLADVECSWEIGAAGTFSAFARVADLRAAGVGDLINGMWIEYASEAGLWGGVIAGRPMTDGVAEISADGYATLLRRRVLFGSDRPVPAGAGAMARRVVLAAAREQPTFVTIGEIDEGGEPLHLALGNADVLDDALPGIVDASDLQWIVDGERRFHAGRRLGRDRSATVRLVEDRHIVSYRTANDLWSVREGQLIELESAQAIAERESRAAGSATPMQPIVASAFPAPVQFSTGAQPFSSFALGSTTERAGLLQFLSDAPPRVYGPRGAEAGWQPLIAAGIPLDLTLANTDHCWASFDIGDDVWIDLGGAGFSGVLTVAMKALNAPARELRIAGEAWAA